MPGISSAVILECRIIRDAINAGCPEAWMSSINSRVFECRLCLKRAVTF